MLKTYIMKSHRFGKIERKTCSCSEYINNLHVNISIYYTLLEATCIILGSVTQPPELSLHTVIGYSVKINYLKILYYVLILKYIE